MSGRWRRLLMVASDRISTYDAVHPTPIPDKGRVLTGLSVFWFEKTGHIVANHLISATEGVPAEATRPGAGRAPPADAAGRVRRARLHHGLGLEGLPGHGQRVGDRAARGPARVRAAARADLHAQHEGRGGPRRGDRLRARGRAGRRPRADGTRARRVGRAVLVRRRARARERGDPGRHQVRVRARRERSGAAATWCSATRCSRPTPRATGRPTATRSAARQPSFDKQYVRDWASRSGWDKQPPAPAIPDDVVAGTRARYVEAYELHHRRALPGVA